MPFRHHSDVGDIGDALRRGDRGLAVAEIRSALAALGLVENPDADLTTGKHVVVDLFDADLDVFTNQSPDLAARYEQS